MRTFCSKNHDLRVFGYPRKDNNSLRCRECDKVPKRKYALSSKGKLSIAKHLKKSIKNRRRLSRQHIIEKYGLTQNEHISLLIAQDFSCAICKVPEILLKEHLCVDHNHETGKVRGLLCRKCNIFLGMSGDSEELLEMGSKYLKEKNYV